MTTASITIVRGPFPLGAGHVEDVDAAGVWVSIPTKEIRCPDCGSTARRCKRPSGWDAAEWHAARRLLASDLLEQAIEDTECEGHESLRGDSMGVTVYCDGACRAVNR